MLVNLQREFRGPDGIVLKPENNPVEFPDDLPLPSGAEKVSAKEAKAAAKEAEAE